MLLVVVGGTLAALGIFCAVALMAASLGFGTFEPGLSIWILFPALTLIGWGLVAAAGRDPTARLSTRAVAVPLVLLALLAAIALVARGAGLAGASGDATALWYVLVLGGVLGLMGTARPGRSES